MGESTSRTDAPSDQQTQPLNPDRWRSDFPILAKQIHKLPLVYLDNAATTQKPRQVLAAMDELYESKYANVHRGIHVLSEESTDLFEAARDTVCRLLGGVSREEVIFTRGTTEAINLVARSWGDKNITEDDEILLTEMEHHANIVPWQQLAARTGASIRWIPITDDGHLDLEAFNTMLSPRTKLVAVTAVSNVLGTINPIEQIITTAHAAGALVLIDAAQSIPHTPTDVRVWDADFVAFGGHKMLGPTGIGVLYGKRQLLESMPPFVGGGGMIRRVRKEGFEAADLPDKFEAGTPPFVEAVGLAAAINYLQSVGLESIADYEQQLATLAIDRLSAIEGVDIFGPPAAERAGIVSFQIEGVHAHDVAQILDRYGIAIRAGHHCAMPLHLRLGAPATARASFYFYNTPAEIEALAVAIEETQKVFRKNRKK